MRTRGPRPSGRGLFASLRRRHGAGVAEVLRAGAPAEVPVRLRRTSARGWGPWTVGVVHLGPPPHGRADWHVDDPVAVGLASTHGPVDQAFEEVTDVFLRSVRFRTEAFWGMDGEIVVVASDRGTIELAVPLADAEPLAARLDALLGPFDGAR